MFRAYGGGPVIGFYDPLGLKEAELKSKLWMEHIISAHIPTVVRSEVILPTPLNLDTTFQYYT